MKVDLMKVDLMKVDLVKVDLMKVDLVVIDLVRIDLMTPSHQCALNTRLTLGYRQKPAFVLMVCMVSFFMSKYLITDMSKLCSLVVNE